MTPVAAKPRADSALAAPPQRYFPALTGMRMVAAMLVFVHHYGIPVQSGWVAGVGRLSKEGYVGVTLFFVLSGFLITHRNYAHASLSFRWLKSYLQNRFARIYPLVFLLMVLELVIIRSLGQPVENSVIALNFSLLKGYVNKWKFSIMPQAWTLTAEETFYVLAPMLLLAVRRGLAWLPLLLVPLGAALFALTPINAPSTFTQTLYFAATYTFFGAFPQFAIGGALAILLIKLGPHYRGPRVPVFTLTGLCCFCFAFFSLGQQSANPQITAALLMPGHNAGWFSHSGIAIVSLAMPISIAILYFGLIVESSGVRSFLSLPLMDLLGKSSYAFYLIQQGVIVTYISSSLTADWGLRLALLLVTSVVLHLYVEVPLNALFRSRRAFAENTRA